MASRTSRKEWMRGLPSAFGEGRYERKLIHSASERSVGYVFLIEESVQKHPNPHPYQTGPKRPRAGKRSGYDIADASTCTTDVVGEMPPDRVILEAPKGSNISRLSPFDPICNRLDT